MKESSKTYSNGEVTVVWQSEKCIHSTICWKNTTGLPEVFNPRERPWIKPEMAATEKIIEQINKCPSGALTYYRNNEETPNIQDKNECLIEVSKNGPLIVHGTIVIKDAIGNEVKKENRTAFCRCGNSSKKPFCDGSHRNVNFQD
jgi:uncharacterized Fe-S cluster protein YjdI